MGPKLYSKWTIKHRQSWLEYRKKVLIESTINTIDRDIDKGEQEGWGEDSRVHNSPVSTLSKDDKTCRVSSYN